MIRAAPAAFFRTADNLPASVTDRPDLNLITRKAYSSRGAHMKPRKSENVSTFCWLRTCIFMKKVQARQEETIPSVRVVLRTIEMARGMKANALLSCAGTRRSCRWLKK